MAEELPPAELGAIETSLRGLQPTAAFLDRDRLMFKAGQESMRRLQMLWPMATAAAVLLAVGLGSVLALRPPVDRVVYVDRAPPAPPDKASPAVEPPQVLERTAYSRLRRLVLEEGVDSLPPPPPVPAPLRGEPL